MSRAAGRTIPPIPEDGIGGVSAEQRRAARRTIANWTAQHQLGASDCAELILMLGLYPGQDNDSFRIPYPYEWLQ